MNSVTQFIWNKVINAGIFSPEKKADASECWLCGADTEKKGWRVKDAIGAAFTDSNIAKSPESDAICQSCAALMKKEGWILACEKHGHDPHFPVKEGKKPFLSNWMFSSHVFSCSTWARPDRKQARNFLLNPPEPPFVITLAAVGKKHVIFRAQINNCKENYFVQLDDESVFVNLKKITALMAEFETAYNLGFSKDSLLTGNYNQAAIMSAGIGVWRDIEARMSAWRMSEPGLMKLCHFCAQKT